MAHFQSRIGIVHFFEIWCSARYRIFITDSSVEMSDASWSPSAMTHSTTRWHFNFNSFLSFCDLTLNAWLYLDIIPSHHPSQLLLDNHSLIGNSVFIFDMSLTRLHFWKKQGEPDCILCWSRLHRKWPSLDLREYPVWMNWCLAIQYFTNPRYYWDY